MNHLRHDGERGPQPPRAEAVHREAVHQHLPLSSPAEGHQVEERACERGLAWRHDEVVT